MPRLSPLLLCALLAAGCGRAVTPIARPVPGAVVALTGYGYHDETSVAINATRPANVIASYQVPATVAASEDAGRTWRSQALPGTAGFQLSGDPSVLFDADGHAYGLYIAFDRPEDYDTLGKAAHRNGIFVNRSDDGGRTWGAQTAVVYQPERAGIPFEDKPMAAVDRSADPARRGHLYVAWTEFRRWQTVILFARSTDGGRSFSSPVEISDRPGSPKDTVGADEGTSLAVGPDGTVYVVWSDSTGILLDRSHDGGLTWGRDVRIARTPDIVFKVEGVARTNGYPVLAVDPHRGRLYVQWVDRRYGGAGILLATSADGGDSWSAPRLVSGNGRGDTRDRFFAWMAFDPDARALVLGYYRVETPGRLVYRLAVSGDGGRTFLRRTWSDDSFPAGGEFLGDYSGVAALGGVAYGVWTEGQPAAGTAQPLHSPGHATRVVVGRAGLR